MTKINIITIPVPFNSFPYLILPVALMDFSVCLFLALRSSIGLLLRKSHAFIFLLFNDLLFNL